MVFLLILLPWLSHEIWNKDISKQRLWKLYMKYKLNKRLKGYIKMVWNRSGKISYVQVKQKNVTNKVKKLIKNTLFKLHVIHQRRGALRTPANN